MGTYIESLHSLDEFAGRSGGLWNGVVEPQTLEVPVMLVSYRGRKDSGRVGVLLLGCRIPSVPSHAVDL